MNNIPSSDKFELAPSNVSLLVKRESLLEGNGGRASSVLVGRASSVLVGRLSIDELESLKGGRESIVNNVIIESTQSSTSSVRNYEDEEKAEITNNDPSTTDAAGGEKGRRCRRMSSIHACIARLILVLTNAVIMIIAFVIFFMGLGLNKISNDNANTTSKMHDGHDSEHMHNPYLEYFALVGVVFVIAGSVCCCLGCMGYYGPLMSSKTLLKAYVFMLNVIFLMSLISILYLYGTRSFGKSYLYTTLSSYRGWESTHTGTQAWNNIMIKGRCCGIDGYEDFQTLKHWPNRSLLIVDQLTPVPCCKSLNDINNRIFNCTTRAGANKNTNLMDKGCYDIFFQDVFLNTAVVIFIISFLQAMFIQLLFGWWIISDIDYEDSKLKNYPVQNLVKKKWNCCCGK